LREYVLYIDGQFVESREKKTFDSINPFNQEVVARVARSGIEDTKRAIAVARKAFDEGPWTRMSKDERNALVKAVSDVNSVLKGCMNTQKRNICTSMRSACARKSSGMTL